MTSVRDGRELAGLALAETIDATQVLSEGALGGNTEASIRSARVSLLDARLALAAARLQRVPQAIDRAVGTAVRHLRAARGALADPVSLPPSFQN